MEITNINEDRQTEKLTQLDRRHTYRWIYQLISDRKTQRKIDRHIYQSSQKKTRILLSTIQGLILVQTLGRTTGLLTFSTRNGHSHTVMTIPRQHRYRMVDRQKKHGCVSSLFHISFSPLSSPCGGL